MFKKILHYS